jgi:hypothetical protein
MKSVVHSMRGEIFAGLVELNQRNNTCWQGFQHPLEMIYSHETWSSPCSPRLEVDFAHDGIQAISIVVNSREKQDIEWRIIGVFYEMRSEVPFMSHFKLFSYGFDACKVRVLT